MRADVCEFEVEIEAWMTLILHATESTKISEWGVAGTIY